MAVPARALPQINLPVLLKDSTAQGESLWEQAFNKLCAGLAKEPIRDPVATTFRKRKEEAENDRSDIIKLTLHDCTTHINKTLDRDPCIVIIDALDECDPVRRHELLEALDNIIQNSSKPRKGLHI